MTEISDGVEDEFSELYDADIARVDLVGKAANGTRFLIAKSDGLVDPDTVRNLIGEQGPEMRTFPAGTVVHSHSETPEALRKRSQRDDVTIKGSPAAVMKMIHSAAQRAGMTPIEAQRQLTLTEAATLAAIPAKETSVTEPDPAVVKADVTDPDEPLADAESVADDADVTVDGDPDDPESPAWEAVDAARATSALELTFALRRLVQEAQGREAQEAAVGADGEDLGNVFDLDDVLCSIDCIIGTLAPFAALEGAEADERQAQLAKGQVMKAGRVLSAQNETRIKTASDALAAVLASLPAPTADDGQPVAKEKETEVTDTATANRDLETVTDELTKAVTTTDPEKIEPPLSDDVRKAIDALAEAAVAKAKGDPQMAVYDANGKLVGTIDGSDLNPIASTEPPAEGDKEPAEGEPTPAQTAAPAAPAAADPDSGAVIPGTSTVAAPAPTTDDETAVTKAAQAGARAALEEILPMLTEKLGANAETESIVKALQERVEYLAKMPDDRKSPRLNGSTGQPGLANRDETQADEYADLRKAVADATTEKERSDATQQLGFAALRDRMSGRL